MLLPSLVFCAKVKATRVLKVRWKHNCLVSRFPWELYPQIPRIESDEGRLEVIRQKMFLVEAIESVDRIPERASTAYMFPSQGSQTSCKAQ